MFDEIEEKFLDKYRESLKSASILEIMIKESKYYDNFVDFLKGEEAYVKVIKEMGRAEQLISKITKIWMRIYEEELSMSLELRKQKDIILPYIAGCTSIYFTNWINDPIGFGIQENTLLSGKFIDYILTMAMD